MSNTATASEEVKGTHPSHQTRMSDASTFDEICNICGFTDNPLGVRGDNVPYGDLAKPCPGPPKDEGAKNAARG